MNESMRRFYDDPAEQKKWGEDLVAQGLYPTEAHLVAQTFKPGATVLDVGCGGGREALALATLGFQVTAIDYTPAFVVACRDGAIQRGVSIRILEADATHLPFADGEFDHVIMVGQLLGHLRPRANRLQALREIHRVMKPGAAIVSTNAVERSVFYRAYFWGLHCWRRFSNPAGLEPYDAHVRSVGGNKAHGNERPVFHWYATPEFRRDADAAGWRIESFLRRWKQEANLADASTSGETFYVLRKD